MLVCDYVREHDPVLMLVHAFLDDYWVIVSWDNDLMVVSLFSLLVGVSLHEVGSTNSHFAENELVLSLLGEWLELVFSYAVSIDEFSRFLLGDVKRSWVDDLIKRLLRV